MPLGTDTRPGPGQGTSRCGSRVSLCGNHAGRRQGAAPILADPRAGGPRQPGWKLESGRQASQLTLRGLEERGSGAQGRWLQPPLQSSDTHMLPGCVKRAPLGRPPPPWDLTTSRFLSPFPAGHHAAFEATEPGPQPLPEPWGQPRPPGAVGQMCVCAKPRRGAFLFTSYFNPKVESANTLTPSHFAFLLCCVVLFWC